MLYDTVNTYPQDIQDKIFQIREVIFSVAEEIDMIDHIDECLKWGELTFVPIPIDSIGKVGTHVRLAWHRQEPDVIAFSVHCNTILIETYQRLFGDAFEYDGKRSLKIPAKGPLDEKAVRLCTKMAFTYFIPDLDDYPS